MSRILPLFLTLALIPSGCARHGSASTETAKTGASAAEEESRGPAWYWFSDSGIHKAPSPAEIPGRTFVPWTEAVRVADVAVIDGVPSFLINRIGVLAIADAQGGVRTDPDRLAKHTAGGFYRTENGTAVRLYRNSFFAADTKSGLFMALYEGATGTFSDLLYAADLALPPQAQCVALDRVGTMWYAAFKSEKDGKVDFTYLEFPSFPGRNPETGAYDLSKFRKLDTSAYQDSVAPFGWSQAPDQLRSLLSALPQETALSVKTRSRADRSPQSYIREGTGDPLTARAWLSDDATSVLFADGTFYFRPDNSTDAVKTLRLPALSAGYVYGDFTLVGRRLIVAWEEQRFFETGRAGLVEISLPEGIFQL